MSDAMSTVTVTLLSNQSVTVEVGATIMPPLFGFADAPPNTHTFFIMYTLYVVFMCLFRFLKWRFVFCFLSITLPGLCFTSDGGTNLYVFLSFTL